MTRATGVIIAVFFTLLAISAARAEEVPKACAAVQNDEARLECYDLIFKKTAAAIPTTSAWQFHQEISKIDDTSNAFLDLDSATSYQDRFGNAKIVSLAIACREGKTNLWLALPSETRA